VLLLLLLLFCAVILLIDTTHERPGCGVSQKHQQPQILTIDPRSSKQISRVDLDSAQISSSMLEILGPRRKTKCHVTCEHVKNDSFHFHFVFFRSRDVNLERTT
jgi:hypothetical protein